MAHISTPTIQTTKDFILIKIPRRMLYSDTPQRDLSRLERGLKKSIKEAERGKLYGPFSNASSFLRALKKPAR